MAAPPISPERKIVFYAGQVIGIVGLVTFLSVFLSVATSIRDVRDPFEARSHVSSMVTRAITGFIMIGIGGALVSVGRKGLAGSGMTLEPEQARRDVEPWSRMTGGIVKDVLDEADVKLGSSRDDSELPFDERLRRLRKLHDDGLVSDAEYESTKKKILDNA